LAEQLVAAAQKLNIECIYEAEMLGNGGTLSYLKSILGQSEYFLTCNGDIIYDMDLAGWVKECIEDTKHSPYIGHLLTIQKPNLVNTIISNTKKELTGIKGFSPESSFPGSETLRSSTFCGIALYHRSFLDYCTDFPADIKPFWQSALDDGKKIKIHVTNDAWFDFGKPQDLWDTYAHLMKIEKNYSYHYTSKTNPEPHVSVECNIPMEVELDHVVVLELSPELKTLAGKILHNKVVGKDFTWDISP
jgi:NDP-sugar pyrophosphorylase family protein